MKRVIAASTIVVVVALTTAFSASPGLASPGVPTGLVRAIHAHLGAGNVRFASGTAQRPEAGFGYSVALSADGTTALVGAPGVAGFTGAAYVFHTSDAGSWVTNSTPTVTLTDGAASDPEALGLDVALSADGTTAFVGAPGGAGGRGAIYVYRASSEDAWASSSAPTATLSVSRGFYVGETFAVSPDGTTLLVGAPAYDSFSGGAYVFHAASEAAWASTSTPNAILSNIAEPSNDDAVGASVAISGDGTTALLSDGYVNNGTGGAYVFHVASESSWASSTSPTAILTDSASSANDFLGYGVALSGDGTTAVLGAPGVNGNTGAVELFQVPSESAWATTSTPAATLSNAGGSQEDLLGLLVAVSSDGATVVAGAPGVGSSAGAAYVFHASSEISWTSTTTPTATLTDSAGVPQDDFGLSLALSSDAATALVGVPGVNSFTGEADVFHASDASSWATTSTPAATLSDASLLVVFCVVPKLKGMTLPEAKYTLSSAGCKSGKVTDAYSSSVATGHVIKQQPTAGKQLPFNSKVNFILSIGPWHKH